MMNKKLLTQHLNLKNLIMQSSDLNIQFTDITDFLRGVRILSILMFFILMAIQYLVYSGSDNIYYKTIIILLLIIPLFNYITNILYSSFLLDEVYGLHQTVDEMFWNNNINTEVKNDRI